MTRGEIWKDFFKKTVLTVLIAGVLFYWAALVFTKDGATNYFYVWLCCGIPFGIRRMFVWLIPRGFDLSGTVGVVALNFIVGGWIGGKLYGRVSVKWLKWLFAGFLFYAGVKYLL